MRSASAGQTHRVARGGVRLSSTAPPMRASLPLFLRLRARPVLVVGGGVVALRKISWLLQTGARITVVAPVLHPELAAHASRGELRHVAAEFEPTQLDDAVIVVSATDQAATNRAVSEAARARGVPVNVVDDAHLSTFIFPAIVERAPLLVAVSTAGEAPVLARRVREQIEALLPARLGRLARFLGARRETGRRALTPRAPRGLSGRP